MGAQAAWRTSTSGTGTDTFPYFDDGALFRSSMAVFDVLSLGRYVPSGLFSLVTARLGAWYERRPYPLLCTFWVTVFAALIWGLNEGLGAFALSRLLTAYRPYLDEGTSRRIRAAMPLAGRRGSNVVVCFWSS